MAGSELEAYADDLMHTRSQNSQVLEFALAAIAARIDGDLENPNLKVFGAVSADPRQDIRQIIRDVRRAVGKEEAEEMPPNAMLTRIYPFALPNPVAPVDDGILP